MQGYDKAMVFIDGENLVIRYQDMINKGKKQKLHTKHHKDVYVWNDEMIPSEEIDLRRVTYYTSAVGSDDYITKLREEIHSFGYRFRGQPDTFHGETRYQEQYGYVVPKLYKKPAKKQRSRQVDINITIDILSHATPRQVDRMILISGDGDFIPLIREVMRRGIQVHVYALSSGLNNDLKVVADKFKLLDSRLLDN
jgi:uncharacterized LabA/DUF88 family protein